MTIKRRTLWIIIEAISVATVLWSFDTYNSISWQRILSMAILMTICHLDGSDTQRKKKS